MEDHDRFVKSGRARLREVKAEGAKLDPNCWRLSIRSNKEKHDGGNRARRSHIDSQVLILIRLHSRIGDRYYRGW